MHQHQHQHHPINYPTPNIKRFRWPCICDFCLVTAATCSLYISQSHNSNRLMPPLDKNTLEHAMSHQVFYYKKAIIKGRVCNCYIDNGNSYLEDQSYVISIWISLQAVIPPSHAMWWYKLSRVTAYKSVFSWGISLLSQSYRLNLYWSLAAITDIHVSAEW